MKSHEKILENFEATIDGFVEGILNQNYITKKDLKVKIKACVINAIKSSKKQGTHEAQIIILTEKIKFKTSEYIRKDKELIYIMRLYKETLNDIELQDLYKKIDNFRKENR